MGFTVVVMAKEPRAGMVKTRLTPPFHPDEAAELARAAIADTLAAAHSSPAARVMVAVAGSSAAMVGLLDGAEHFCQQGESLGSRLDHALEYAWRRTRSSCVVVGMDTPQVTPRHLQECIDLAVSPGRDAAVGPAVDGGFWSLAFRAAPVAAMHRVAMSRPDTGRQACLRLRAAGVSLAQASQLEDVDDAASAARVAAAAPDTRFAVLHRRLTGGG
jgi:hypothetical protein